MPSNTAKKMDPKSLSANNYIALVTAVVILVVVACSFILYMMIKSIILNTKLIGHKNKAAHTLKQNVENADRLIEAYDLLGNRKDLINFALPSDADFPQLVAISENMANAAGLKLTSVAPAIVTDSSVGSDASGSQASSSNIKTFNFTMSVTGSYGAVAKLMENIQLSARPMRVIDAQFKGETKELKVDITVESYYQEKADISTKTETLK